MALSEAASLSLLYDSFSTLKKPTPFESGKTLVVAPRGNTIIAAMVEEQSVKITN
jgi:hypothetical protein